MHKTHSKARNDRFNANRTDRMDTRFNRNSGGYRDQAEGRWMTNERNEGLAQERAQFSTEQFDQGYRERDRGAEGRYDYGDVSHGAIDRTYRASERSYGDRDRSFANDYTSQYGDRGYVGPNAMSDLEDSWSRRASSRREFDRDYRNDRWGADAEYGMSRDFRNPEERGWNAACSGRSNYGGAYSGGFSSQPAFVGKGPKGYQRSDERIREEICERLSEGHLDASNVEVHVSDGQVTLSGTVTERRAKRIAEEIAELARGVKDIENKLKVAKAETGGRSAESTHKRVTGLATTLSASQDLEATMPGLHGSLSSKRQNPQA